MSQAVRERDVFPRSGEAAPIRPFGGGFAFRRQAEGPRSCFLDPASAPLASLAGGALARRFHSWRGAGGRRYVFTVHDEAPADWPDYADAVFALVLRGPDGARRLLLAWESGDAAAVDLAQLLAGERAAGGGLELHVHLLADTTFARRAVLADLGALRFTS